jgi:integrase/recombinase XerD
MKHNSITAKKRHRAIETGLYQRTDKQYEPVQGDKKLGDYVLSQTFQKLHKGFTKELQTFGYAWQTVRSMPATIDEFFRYIESLGITTPQRIRRQHIDGFFGYLKTREHYRKPGVALSRGTILKSLNGLKRFAQYLLETEGIALPIHILIKEPRRWNITYLTREEIKSLYDAIDFYTPFGQRDQVMLSVAYGCGLRRSEMLALNVADVNIENRMLYVKGKQGRDRQVPMSKTTVEHIQAYLDDAREELLKGKHHEALFISERGQLMDGMSLNLRLLGLQKKSGNPTLMEKKIGLHTLRHSIATHLLQSGMKLKNIQRFLGHLSIESTQVYIHLTENNKAS